MRWWQYEFDGKGIVPATSNEAPYLGSAIHDALSAIASFHQLGSDRVDIDVIVEAAWKQVFDAFMESAGEDYNGYILANEQAALVEGMIRGFYRHVWPSLIAEFPTIVLIESEMTYEH